MTLSIDQMPSSQVVPSAGTAAMNGTDTKNPITQRHPWYDYQNHIDRWQRWRAIMEGFDDDAKKRNYLPASPIEQPANHDVRLKLSHFLGVSEVVVDQIVGAVLGQDPHVEVDDGLKGFLENVDGAGTSLPEFVEALIREAAPMGIAFVLVEGRPNKPNKLTRQQEQDDGTLSAFFSVLTAEQVINWKLDDGGRLQWVVCRFVGSSQAGPLDPITHHVEYRLYDRQTVRTWMQEADENGHPKGNAGLIEQPNANPTHGLGEVPLYPLQARRLGPMRGGSLIQGSARADIATFNDDSWDAVARYRHAHPLLKGWLRDELDVVMKGGMIRLKPGDGVNDKEDVEYTDLPSGSFDAREKAINRQRQAAITLSGMNPQSTTDAAGSTTGESGIAQRVRFTHTQKRIIDSFSRKVAATMKRALDAAELRLTSAITDKTFALRSSFEVTETSDMIRDLDRVTDLVQSPTLIKALQKRLAAKMLGPEDRAQLETINAEIEAAKVEERKPENDFRS